jgi:mono/diheme cytochrome c family protein
MADKKGVGHAYNIDFLNVVFAACNLFFFITVIWMVWDDFDRDWKDTQRRFTALEEEVTRANLDKMRRGGEQAKLKQLEAQRQAAEKQVEANRQAIQEAEQELAAVEARLYVDTQNYNFAKATYDVDRYDYEVRRDRGDASAERKGQEVAELEKRVAELNLQREKTEAEQVAVRNKIGGMTSAVTAVTQQISDLTTEQSRLEKRLDTIAPSLVKDYFRNAPLLDFMAPTIKVNQILLPNIHDDVNFTRVAKMDRCTTCHLGIDKRGYENYPQPFKTHPNLSTYLGSDSPHPIDQIGCTVCHEGMGQSVSFADASHTPRDEKQQKEWEEKYHWHEPHLWDYPMHPTPMTEASCVQCHRGEVALPTAPKLNMAYATYERAGCYACHKTKGFENLRKPGPILTKISSKLSPEWVKTWIRNPRAVKPATWMPRVWYNSNSNAPEDARRNEVEIDAAVAYLFANAEPYQLPVPSPPRGDAKSGEQIVKSIGCLGCHVVDETNRSDVGPRRTFGQPLQAIGSKTTYAWLYNWVRDPKHYNPGTYMPDLRLTDAQTADVATYLSLLKETKPGDPARAKPDEKATEDVLLEYLRAVVPFEEARAQVAKLDAKARQLALGQRVIGRYGCFSCHEIKGFENTQPNGTELSEEGSKLVTRLDFAFVDIPHVKTAWFHQKLKDPRSFDQGRVLRPEERLRMPNFEFSEEEIARLELALLSFQRDIQPAAALAPRSARADGLRDGRAFVRRRNCVGCHTIEGEGGDYLKLVADPTLGPPLLTPEGAKVQPDWLYAFLRSPITIRPWLSVRMPTFGLNDAGWNTAIRYFGSISNTIGPFRTFDVVRASTAEPVGKQLFDLLQCQKCHVLGAIPKDQETSNLAPDLRMASERLQSDWILDWLRNPARIQPGTRMPAFWPDFPKSYYPHLGGSAEKQIQAIRDHVLTFRGGPSPKRPSAAGTVTAND